ncbi:MAG: transglycosylase SLT domain-containing protein [Gallionella sp.]|nr:transglycosylase SLT domain-containing protein [Gallionella sp.]
MQLIRFVLPLLLALSFCTSTQAAELLAMSTVNTDNFVPTSLTNAHNVTLELLPQSEPVAESDLWERIRAGYTMPELDSNLIARHERYYADRPEYVARMTERAGRYLHYITEEVERRGMPTEIALLPMIESAFNPGAYSHSSASGIWQFIPSTGRHFGLQQNWWYDGRRDVVSATNGALDYLEKLHAQFGDWALALAAYNCGEGAVDRAQKHNRRKGLPIDYLSLKLPNETRNYVPKLMAIKNIVAHPEVYGLTLAPIPNQPYFTAITTDKQMDVKMFAELADISEDEFLALNPAHNRPVILQDHNDLILLPIGKVETFLSNLESNDKPLVSWQSYQPKKGERFDQLAPRFGMTVAKLKSVNGLSPRADRSSGQTLLVPLQETSGDTELEAFNMHLLPSYENQFAVSHTVRRGDTLGAIARRYHVSLAKLRAWNHGAKIIRPGQKLHIVQSSGSHSSKHSTRSKRHAQQSSKKLAKN